MIFIINFIIKDILQSLRTMKYLTPQKMAFKQNLDTTRLRLTSDSKIQSRTIDVQKRFTQSSVSRIDYKSKTFQLLANVSDLENRQKSQAQTIFFLQRELQKINRQIQIFLSSLGAKSLAQAAQKILKHYSKKDLKPNSKVEQQYAKILEQYKTIITKQQQKFVKIQARYKDSNQGIKKYEQQRQNLKSQLLLLQQQIKQHRLVQAQNSILKDQNKNLNEKISISQNQSKKHQKKIQEQTQEIKKIKNQFKFFIEQKSLIQEKYQNLKIRYKQEINHFQQIQNEVQVKLIQVQKEMNAYRQQKQDHLYQLKMLKEQLRVRQQQREFSFGGFQHAYVQTDQTDLVNDFQQQYLPSFNMQCYQSSIKSLLQQNNRLKRALINLAQRSQGQELSVEAQLQLKLLIGVKQIRKNDKQRQKQIKSQSKSKIQADKRSENSKILAKQKENTPKIENSQRNAQESEQDKDEQQQEM